nr:MAG TPA: hypothetical protein [Caudoviricetes sp.]
MKVIKQAYFESKSEGAKLKSRTVLIIEVEGELYTEVVFNNFEKTEKLSYEAFDEVCALFSKYNYELKSILTIKNKGGENNE